MTCNSFSSTAFLESPDSKRIRAQISKAYDEFCLAVKAGRRFEAKGIAILGPTGTGKTEGTMQALESLGMVETIPGDTERPLLKLDLGARATLKSLSSDILEELGWPEMPRSSGQSNWRSSRNYMAELNTKILVLDEIQHVRSTGKQDREDLQDFLKSMVKPSRGRIMPILIGLPVFNEILESDGQLDRRYSKIRMRSLDPAIDLARTIKTLKKICDRAAIELAPSVKTQEFAARLMHAGMYGFGSTCVWSQRGVATALDANASELTNQHFQNVYQQEEDCVPALNPFITDDFETIKIKPQQ